MVYFVQISGEPYLRA